MNFKSIISVGVALAIVGCSSSTVNEQVEQTYPTGAKKKVNYWVGTKKNIIHTVFYFPSGAIQSDEYFKKEKPDSTMTIFYKSGTKYRETHFTEGAKTGPERSWYEKGQLMSETDYANDTAQGKAVTYFEDGKTASEVTYVNGKKNGDEIVYFPAGQVKHQQAFVNGDATGAEKEFFENGKPKAMHTWMKNVLDGPYTTYQDDGSKETGSYKAGAYDGERTMYNEKGKVVSEATFKDGNMVEGSGKYH